MLKLRWRKVAGAALACAIAEPMLACTGASSHVAETPAGVSWLPVASPPSCTCARPSVAAFGARPDDDVDDTAPIQRAIDAMRSGGTLFFGPGRFLVRGLRVPQDRLRLVGSGRATVLAASADGAVIVMFSGSEGGVESLSFAGNGHREVTALAVTPDSGSDPAAQQHQDYDRFSNLDIAGVDDGIVLQAGAATPHGDSGCWYNVFDTILIRYARRGIWMRSPMGKTGGSSVNRNQFYSVRVGEFVNTGVQIDAGSDNTFFGCSFEGIAVGSFPTSIPTAIVIHHSGAQGADNNSNRFFGCSFEANTRDVNNENPTTEFHGSTGRLTP